MALPPPDPLDPLFQQWRDTAPPPADNLESTVWRRLAALEDQASSRSWADAIEAAFARPSFKAVFVAACVLLGLFIAEARVSQMLMRRSSEFVQGYLQEIDPQLADSVGPETSTPTRS